MFVTQLLEHCKFKDIKNWSKNEVLLLIAAYKEHQLEFLDVNVNNDEVWKKVANDVNETLSVQDLPPIANEKFKTKWETLKRHYKGLKDSNKKSGNSSITWAFYDEMEEVFGEQPWVKPLSTAGSNSTNKMDPEIISPPRKRQKTLTSYCEELLAAKKENSEIRKQHHREKIASMTQLSCALNKLVEHITKGQGDL
ncbi:unnamed protein product [Pieris macdunnoughi]|uniref:Myb/SANT-like DNA-binding domain-containing protein n=1 Tax=Pieris macdunnoughi TaxID=345717 RepID=A0A821XMG0_9NEOP|nr:unnamed protein product [Pieris macdunnoughi]